MWTAVAQRCTGKCICMAPARCSPFVEALCPYGTKPGKPLLTIQLWVEQCLVWVQRGAWGIRVGNTPFAAHAVGRDALCGAACCPRWVPRFALREAPQDANGSGRAQTVLLHGWASLAASQPSFLPSNPSHRLKYSFSFFLNGLPKPSHQPDHPRAAPRAHRGRCNLAAAALMRTGAVLSGPAWQLC